jgi:hypothetical protein
MKFITSRILSPSETKSLADIVAEIEDKNRADEASEMTVKTASNDSQIEKTASSEETDTEEKTDVEASEEADVKDSEEKADVEASEEETTDVEAKEEDEDTDSESASEVEITIASKETDAKTAEAEKSYKITDIKVKTASKESVARLAVKFQKTATLTEKDRAWLLKFYKVFWPADYAEAALGTY